MLHWLGGKELRHQIESAIAKAQAVENHRHRGRAYTHPFMRVLILRIQPLRQSDLATDPGHDAQMIQAFWHIRSTRHPARHALLLSSAASPTSPPSIFAKASSGRAERGFWSLCALW